MTYSVRHLCEICRVPFATSDAEHLDALSTRGAHLSVELAGDMSLPQRMAAEQVSGKRRAHAQPQPLLFQCNETEAFQCIRDSGWLKSTPTAGVRRCKRSRAAGGRALMVNTEEHDGLSHANRSTSMMSRRTMLVAPLAPSLLVCRAASAAAPTEASLVAELRKIAQALEPLPGMLDEEKWDAVRTVLKAPPVGYLWQIESKNTIRKLGDMRGDVDMLEAADDVAGALQLCDQFTYDNNFIYFQPGSGKIKIKEPKEQLAIATKKINAILDSTAT